MTPESYIDTERCISASQRKPHKRAARAGSAKCETLDLWNAARTIAANATMARSGKAARDLLTGSTITVTSLGALGDLATTPVINYPEVAIVGPNKIIERPVSSRAIAIRRMMHLSSSFDHTSLDGFDAAEFIPIDQAAVENARIAVYRRAADAATNAVVWPLASS